MDWTSSLWSTIAGYISIVFWLIVFIPQLKENYQRRNGDGLSLSFLFIWLVGDLFNLAGVVMENLMTTMFLLALWYTVADIGLIWQVIYYQECIDKDSQSDQAIALVNQKSLKHRRVSIEKERLLTKLGTPAEVTTDTTDIITISSKPRIKKFWVNTIGCLVLLGVIVISCLGFKSSRSSVIDEKEGEDIRLLPQVLGWCSCFFYIGSRIPQLVKNWKQQSTDGLSAGMFVCAMFGNLFFSMSIFLKSIERRYIIVHLPWIIGSLGTVIFDIMIFLQFYTFNRRKLE